MFVKLCCNTINERSIKRDTTKQIDVCNHAHDSLWVMSELNSWALYKPATAVQGQGSLDIISIARHEKIPSFQQKNWKEF